MVRCSANSEPKLPRGWTKVVRSGVLHALALANYVAACAAVKRRSTDERKDHEIAVLREMIELKDARMARMDPHRRPHYSPPERMRILELKAVESWSLERIAAIFQVTEPTVALWLARLDEQGSGALVQTAEPVNKFPFLVAYLVKWLKTLHPELGKRKLAATLARAGLHLGATTVARLLKSRPSAPPEPSETRHEAPRTLNLEPRTKLGTSI
jgi:hypothetical protein